MEYTNQRLLHNPYLTDPTVQTNERGTSYTYQVVTETDDNVTFNTSRILPQFIDRADLAQSTFLQQMEMADRQAQLVNEAIESNLYAQHASFYDFDNSFIGGGAGNITVSNTNVDDIIRNVKRVIRLANGDALLQRNGGFIIWRPADFEKLENFMQANGFVTSDSVLREGAVPGVRYMGLDHYSSNLMQSGHIVGGVKKALHLGILRDTYGQLMVDDKDPNATSGISLVTRADFGFKLWNKMGSLVMDIAVA